MKIALIGYGKMGKVLENCIQADGSDTVLLRITEGNRRSTVIDELKKADVAIEFTRPDAAVDNISWCLDAGVPVVVGTTGWYDHLPIVTQWCKEKNGAVVYASNFSIGVNIFFELNRKLAEMMKSRPEYEPVLTEIHHTQKKDVPSGTAITLAEDLIRISPVKRKWVSELNPVSPLNNVNPSELIILSRREESVVGTHTVTYKSAGDEIEIRHAAHSREGFAMGALAAAKWIQRQKGVHAFADILNSI